MFPPDLLDQVATGDVEGQREIDFGLSAGQRLSTEMQSAFSDIRKLWDAFQSRLGFSHESPTTLTREAWVLLLLERLGCDDPPNAVVFQRSSAEAGGETYPISHRAGEDPDAPPIHIVAIGQLLDQRGDGARRSPHSLVQEYLNRAPALWGIVTNGEQLRLLRDTNTIAKPTYLEFDLRGMVEQNLYSEFVLLYRLLHRSRLPRSGDDAHECRLEKYYQQGIDQGGRVRDHLRDGVEGALRELGTAFLAHPESQALREPIQSGRLDAVGYYRELLRLVYRFLFLMVVEERRLLFLPEAENVERQTVYIENYSMARLRNRAEQPASEDGYGDLWEGLKQTFFLFRTDGEDYARQIGLTPLNGELFGPLACQHLEAAACDNTRLLRALFQLSTFRDERGVRRRVNYAGLDVEELGSVYEGLLDFHPYVELEPQAVFDLVTGSERKQTGSYYTPPSLVRELIESALVPVMEDGLSAAGTREEKEAALLGLRVVDPASGSGHFLLAAARRIARELAKVRTGEGEPAREAYRAALRDVIRCCIYAVDKNLLAVDLCKVALWVEGYNAGLPLSFLDNHVKHGDSLVGVASLDVLPLIPEGAYAPVTGDDKAFASTLRKRNREEEKQLTLFEPPPIDLAEIAQEFRRLGLAEERTPYDVWEKERAYQKLRNEDERVYDLARACDLWTAAFFLPLRRGSSPGDEVPTTSTVRSYQAQPRAANAAQVGVAQALASGRPFFHWPVEFPDVFARGGFDVVLGNPPWERIKLQEEEFFAARDRDIAEAPNKAARARLIKTLFERNPSLAREFDAAKHAAEAASKFIRSSGRFPLCGRGDVNTYSVFAEMNRSLLRRGGRSGCIVPSGIATDDTTKGPSGNKVGKCVQVSYAGQYEGARGNQRPLRPHRGNAG